MAAEARAAGGGGGLFAVPAPVRELFKRFPLRTNEPVPLPWRTPSAMMSQPKPALYVFAHEERNGLELDLSRPSFNPSCLKWQTFLRIAGVDVDIVSSNNHASPSGSLPFLLLPPPTPTARTPTPLTGSKIYRYARDHASTDLPPSPPAHRLEAYQALLDQAIRPAWVRSSPSSALGSTLPDNNETLTFSPTQLYALYLNPANISALKALYLPSSPLLAYPIHHSLCAAATAEILRTTRAACILPDQLLANAGTALSALSTLLADQDWFFGAKQPGLFDAEVFAYTYLLDDSKAAAAVPWEENSLGERLRRFDNLVVHRKRLLERCWGCVEDPSEGAT